MLCLAHDGSLNADWLSHYALRCALALGKPELRVLFVEDGTLTGREFEDRLQYLRREAGHAGVELEVEHLPKRGSVAETLLQAVPAGPDSFMLCGTRVRQRNLTLLGGTVSERLLKARRFNVLAVRIVNPGLLGSAQRLLVPVMGHPRGFASGIPFLRLLGRDVQRVHVLLVAVELKLGWHGVAPDPASVARGAVYVDRIQGELRPLFEQAVHLDGSVVPGTDPADEIVLAAKQHHCQLIYLGASERGFAERLIGGLPYEKILAEAPCDVAIYRGVS